MGFRCFVALEVAPEVRERLAELQQALRTAAPQADVRWVRPDAIHLTLAFLGIVPETLVGDVAAAARKTAESHAPFRLAVNGLGGFPTPRAPRILWARVADENDAAERLAKAVQSAVAPLGYPPEKRAFRPHLTIGRVRSPRGLRPLVEAIAARRALEDCAWPVDEVVLFRSHLKPTGSVYEALARTPLASVP